MASKALLPTGLAVVPWPFFKKRQNKPQADDCIDDLPCCSLQCMVGWDTNYGFIIYAQVRMTKLLVMLSVAVRRIRRIRVQVLVIFRARGISFARPVAPPPEVDQYVYVE